MSIRDLADQIRLLTSRITQLTSPICEELLSQIVIDLMEDESAVTLTSVKELQDFQGKGSTNAVENKTEEEEMKPQFQIIQVNESSE